MTRGGLLTNIHSVDPQGKQLQRMPWPSSTRASATSILLSLRASARKIIENWNISKIYSSFLMTSYRKRSRNPRSPRPRPKGRRGMSHVLKIILGGFLRNVSRRSMSVVTTTTGGSGDDTDTGRISTAKTGRGRPGGRSKSGYLLSKTNGKS